MTWFPVRWRWKSTKVVGCGKNKDHVLLKIDHIGAEKIMEKLPGIREISIQFAGIDPIKDPIPVVPTTHYMMGGIPTNYHGEVVVPQGEDYEVPVKGLYAAGECACAPYTVRTAWVPTPCWTWWYSVKLPATA